MIVPKILRHWWAQLGASAVVALVITLMLFNPSSTFYEFAVPQFLVTLTYTLSIGVPGIWLLPKLSHQVRSLPILVQWLAFVVTILLFTLVGSLATEFFFLALGVFHWENFFGQWLHNVRLAMLISSLMGISWILRSKLELTTLHLRERELEKQKALRLASEAQFASLASRIHPHFLFNTLNSISSLIREDPPRAEQMLEGLASLLRYSLDANQRPLVPLEQEMKVVTDYLEIERTRFGERLKYEIDLPGEWDGVLVPPLSLQTLVENSVKHAIAPRPKGGTIRVIGRADDSSLELQVWDDGPGFRNGSFPKGHGLDNLKSRLEAVYGEGATVRVSQRPPDDTGLKTLVAMVLPSTLKASRSG